AIFLVRTFNEYCKAHKSLEHVGEEKMPEVTRLAFYLQNHLNTLVHLITEDVTEELDAETCYSSDKTGIVEQQFIVEQILLIACTVDYGDEIGRRKMFSLMRDSLALVQLPDSVTRLIVQVLVKISQDEKHFCMLILEVIAEIQDELEDDTLSPITGERPVPEDDNESFHSALS